MDETDFEWDDVKSLENERKHGISFYEAQYAFLDERRVIAQDLSHSQGEFRYYCFGLDREGTGVLTVRFTFRAGRIRIFGAGYWRKGRKVYERTNSL
ncbi:MAG: BrnT family toxin [Gammaproteobacteria bacterium]|nr:BrnT family toxin [Gammaproteobacteria bacterium]